MNSVIGYRTRENVFSWSVLASSNSRHRSLPKASPCLQQAPADDAVLLSPAFLERHSTYLAHWQNFWAGEGISDDHKTWSIDPSEPRWAWLVERTIFRLAMALEANEIGDRGFHSIGAMVTQRLWDGRVTTRGLCYASLRLSWVRLVGTRAQTNIQKP